MAKYAWKLLFSVPGCHRWFRDELSGRVAACDQSGRTPDLTDDGVLWLPKDCRITRERHRDDLEWYETVSIPLELENGRPAQLGGTNISEAIELVKRQLARFDDRI